MATVLGESRTLIENDQAIGRHYRAAPSTFAFELYLKKDGDGAKGFTANRVQIRVTSVGPLAKVTAGSNLLQPSPPFVPSGLMAAAQTVAGHFAGKSANAA